MSKQSLSSPKSAALTTYTLPESIDSEQQLEALLARPYPETIELMRRLDGDIAILGASGKMGPSLVRLILEAIRAAGVQKRVIAAARFSDARQMKPLEEAGAEPIRSDLSDPEEVKRLPSIRNVLYLAGRKFGERGSESSTWIGNVVAASNVARRFAMEQARTVAFSTGCVYPLVDTSAHVGSSERDEPAPVGEYANSCLGRERVFEYYAARHNAPLLLYRLNYAIDLRYGVLADIGWAVWEGRPVDVTAGAVNVIWQGDANNRAVLGLGQTSVPTAILNITGPETLDVRQLAVRFSELLGREVRFASRGESRGYLSNASRSIELFGPPRVSVDNMIQWLSQWIKRGGSSLGKPTHYAVTDGQFLDPT